MGGLHGFGRSALFSDLESCASGTALRSGRGLRAPLGAGVAVSGRFLHSPWASLEAPDDYAPRIVDHAEAREVALERFGDARAKGREN